MLRRLTRANRLFQAELDGTFLFDSVIDFVKKLGD
jgi:hypothetical protein